MSVLYYIQVQYNNVKFNAMIDCGAQISIISTAMVRKLGLLTCPINGIVRGIGQTTMKGKVPNCKLHIVNQTLIPITVDFIVLQQNNLIILGLDFLEKYKCIINCNFKMLHIDGNKVPLVIKYSQPIKPIKPVAKPVTKVNKNTKVNKK